MRIPAGLIPVVLLAAAVGGGRVYAQSAPAAGSCGADGRLGYVCGLVNVEDFLPVGTHYLVGSSYQAGPVGLYLVDTDARTSRAVSLSVAVHPDARFGGCAAPDLKGLSTHGLDVVPGTGRWATVYAVNHGGRESVEVFRLNVAGAGAEWIGCVILPPGANGNSVAALPDGGFVVTKFLDNADTQAFAHILAGRINGLVYRWTPGRGFTEVPGTRLSGDNGILVSRDGSWIYVNAYGTREVYRVPLSGGGRSSSVKVDFCPDNLRWAPDGGIFVTGQFIDAQHLNGPHGWATVRLDPQTMMVTAVFREPGHPHFDDATSAVQVGHTLWFGTFRGDRIAYAAAP